MSKIAIVGGQRSGKTVFMASMTDYFRAGQRPDQMSWLIPENSDAHKFTERRKYEMRVQGIWPEATLSNPVSLKWSLHQRNGTKSDIEMLEFKGEVFRAAFREEGPSDAIKEATEQLVSYLIDSDFVVVLVGLNELFRSSDETELFEEDIESTWVTRGLIDFVKHNLPPNVGLLVALTHADLYKKELEEYGGAVEVLKAKWPMIYALYPDVPVVAVASVSNTTADGRPAPGYTTEGVLPVMKAYSEFLHGDPSKVIREMKEIAESLRNIGHACPLELLKNKVLRHRGLIDDLRGRVSIVDALYEDDIKTNMAVNEECSSFLTALESLSGRSPEERLDHDMWEDFRARYTALSGTVDVFEEEAVEEARKSQQDKERRAAEEIKAREDEAQRLEESAKQDEERRRKLDLKKREQAAAAEALRIEKDRIAAASRAFAIRAAIVLIAIGTIAGGAKLWRDSAEKGRIAVAEADRKKEKALLDRIESENAVKLAEARKAESEQRMIEEKNRAEELAQRKLEEENRQKELLLKQQEEEQRKIREENEKCRLELERRKAEEEKALEEERRKRIAEENRQRQIEIEREEALRRAAAEAKQREVAAEQQKRFDAERKEKARLEAETAARKLSEDKARAAGLVDSFAAAVSGGVVDRAMDLVKELRPMMKLLSPNDKKRYDEVYMAFNTLSMASAGDEDYIVKLANAYYRGTNIFKVNRTAAYKWYLKAADAGSPSAQYNVGVMALNGDGTVKNDVQAQSYLLKSAEMNFTRAQYLLATMYRDGKGVEKDDNEANRWFERGAQLGDSRCQLVWSRRLENGDGMFFSDKDAALEWLKKAAKNGSGEACYLIGCQYYEGKGKLPLSMEKARDMFVKAKGLGFSNKAMERKLKACELSLKSSR